MKLKELKKGDRVSRLSDGVDFIVMSNYLGYATAVRATDIINPDMWMTDSGRRLKSIMSLSVGNIVRPEMLERLAFVVTEVTRTHATAVMSVTITKKDLKEWSLVKKANYT